MAGRRICSGWLGLAIDGPAIDGVAIDLATGDDRNRVSGRARNRGALVACAPPRRGRPAGCRVARRLPWTGRPEVKRDHGPSLGNLARRNLSRRRVGRRSPARDLRRKQRLPPCCEPRPWPGLELDMDLGMDLRLGRTDPSRPSRPSRVSEGRSPAEVERQSAQTIPEPEGHRRSAGHIQGAACPFARWLAR
jgi:hypothetical protein